MVSDQLWDVAKLSLETSDTYDNYFTSLKTIMMSQRPASVMILWSFTHTRIRSDSLLMIWDINSVHLRSDMVVIRRSSAMLIAR